MFGSFTRSFRAGRRPALSTDPWSPSTDISPVAWVDASDSSYFSKSGSTLTSVTDKTSTYTLEINGTPTVVSNGLNSLSVFDFDGSENIKSTTYEAQVDGSGNHWAIGVYLADTTDNNKDSLWSYETNQSPKRDYAISSSAANMTSLHELAISFKSLTTFLLSGIIT